MRDASGLKTARGACDEGGKGFLEAVKIFECISGDTAFGYSLAFCQSIEKILGINVPVHAQILRILSLELERLYNHKFLLSPGPVGDI